jgi:hypothetical protein
MYAQVRVNKRDSRLHLAHQHLIIFWYNSGREQIYLEEENNPKIFNGTEKINTCNSGEKYVHEPQNLGKQKQNSAFNY